MFDPASGLVIPFPSDLFAVEDPTTPTGLRVSFTLANSAAEPMFSLHPSLHDELNALDGWGTTAGVVFAFSQEIGTVTTVAGEAVVSPLRPKTTYAAALTVRLTNAGAACIPTRPAKGSGHLK